VKTKGKIALVMTLVLLGPVLTFASEPGIVKIQGVVMAVNLKQNSLTVNERTFSWTLRRSFQTRRGSPWPPTS